MPFPMKIQPIDYNTDEEPARFEPVKPVVKSRLKRLFERQFPSVLRNSAAEKAGFEELHFNAGTKDGPDEFEPSSLCLAKMVQNFIEDSNEKQSSAARNGRNRCNCFNGASTDSSEDEMDAYGGGFGDSNFSSSGVVSELLKSLVSCPSVCERNLLADTARIVEKNKISKRKDDFTRKIVTDGLLSLGYDASLCKSRWEKSPSYPAGYYEYIDVIIEGDRFLIDIDFRSEFEIARSTKAYKSILQALPNILVGKADRLQRIISMVSEAGKQSLKKKGMHIPPWRKAEYMKAKWLSPFTRIKPISLESKPSREGVDSVTGTELGESESASVFVLVESPDCKEEEATVAKKEWKPPEVKPKNLQLGIRIVTGLASVFEDEP